jgi:SHAQKYF class myb-like DNA-binding protein
MTTTNIQNTTNNIIFNSEIINSSTALSGSQISQLKNDLNHCEGRWTHEEHIRFLKGCLLYSNNWKKVESYVQSRTSTQIRSHAQKYLIKLNKKYKICDENNLDSKDESDNSMNNMNIYNPIINNSYINGENNNNEINYNSNNNNTNVNYSNNEENINEILKSLDDAKCDLEIVEKCLLKIFKANNKRNGDFQIVKRTPYSKKIFKCQKENKNLNSALKDEIKEMLNSNNQEDIKKLKYYIDSSDPKIKDTLIEVFNEDSLYVKFFK